MLATLTATTMADRLMGTGTSRGGACLAGLAASALAALALAACGGSQRTATQGAGAASAGSQSGAFSWLRPQPPPSSWHIVQIATGAELAFPQTWSHQRSDQGTASAALLQPDGNYLGYLNLTPRQGNETLSNWSSFRVEHNREEGDHAVQRLAAATGLRFLTGSGSCVKDVYTTKTGSRFVEIACLIDGSRAQSVVVGAAPPNAWAHISAVIERAISGVRT